MVERTVELAPLTNEELAQRVVAAIVHPFQYLIGDPECPGCQAQAALYEIMRRLADAAS